MCQADGWLVALRGAGAEKSDRRLSERRFVNFLLIRLHLREIVE